MSQQLVIIGNGMAATRLLSELTATCGSELRITVIGDEDQPGYNRVLLSRLLSEEIEAGELVTHNRDWYAQHHIRLLTGVRVNAIDREQKKVSLEDGRERPYDRLVLATGARPFVPPVDGLALDGVMTFRHMQDCQ
ncbi:MAG: FAD-dependent oxidoreductase, partial [Alcanivoracaceae bacterium]